MLRRLLTCLLLLASLVALPGRTLALPPSPQVDQWNEGPAPVRMLGETDADFLARRRAWIQKRIDRLTWNCYNYGVNIMTFDGAGDPSRAQPGKGMAYPGLGLNITAANMCTKTMNRAINDGLHAVAWVPGQPIPAPPMGENLVALGGLAGVKGNGADYHWWRLNGDGSWSHKRGGTPAKTTYTDNTGAEKPLTDPRVAAQRDGYDLCGFMSVPKAALPNIGTLSAAPTCTPGSGTVVVQSVDPSGLPDPQRVLSPVETSQLVSHLPSFSPGNRISDPHFPALPAGTYEGWFVITNPDGQSGVPATMRVYLGTVEVVRAAPDTEGVEFYQDNQGLESFLNQDVGQQSTDACPNGQTTAPLSACQCSDEALGGSPTATLLSIFQAQGTDAGVRVRWQYSDPAQILSTDVERMDTPGTLWHIVSAIQYQVSGGVEILDTDVQTGHTYQYQLHAIGADDQAMLFGPISVTAGGPVLEFALDHVRPNPTRGPAQISFALPRDAFLRLSIVDIQGRELAVLMHGPVQAGRHATAWDGRTSSGRAPSGRYFAQLQVAGRKLVQSFVLAP